MKRYYVAYKIERVEDLVKALEENDFFVSAGDIRVDGIGSPNQIVKAFKGKRISKESQIIFDNQVPRGSIYHLMQGKLEETALGTELHVFTDKTSKRLMEFADSYEPESSRAHNSSQAEACSPRSP